ncbi:Piwi domain-containing protein [Xylaria nigripes]|nr:Piwi domain-containing protein [Xylaria nigripes]
MSGFRAPRSIIERVSNLDLDARSSRSRGSAAGSHHGSGAPLRPGPGSGVDSPHRSSKADVGHGTEVDKQLRPVDFVGKRVDLPADAYLVNPDKGRFTIRPGFNTKGKPIQVQLNIFPVLDFKDQQTIYQYDVNVSPNPRESRALIKKVWNSEPVQKTLRESGGKWLHDGNKLAWSSREIKRNEFRATVDLDSDKPSKKKVADTGVYYVQVRQSKTINLHYLDQYLNGKISWDNHVLECMNLFDHCLRQSPSETMIQIRRNFYPRDGTGADLSSVVEVRKGYYAAARLSEAKRVMINVDTANTAFWQNRRVSEIALSMFNEHDPKWSDLNYLEFCRYLKPMKISDKNGREILVQSEAFGLLRRLHKVKFNVKHRGKQQDEKLYTIRHFIWADYYGPDGAHSKNVKFDKKMPDGSVKSTSVYDHYKETHNFGLQFPWLPIIETTRGGLFPMELCNIADHQRYPFKLNPSQTASMIKFAVTRPPKRRADILEGVEEFNYARDPYLKEFGIQISTSMQITNAKLLSNPEVTFQGNAKLNPGVTGRWDLRGKRFIEPNLHAIKSWGFVVCGNSCTKAEAEVFASKFSQQYRNHGGNIKSVMFVTQIPFSFGDYGDICKEAYERVKSKFQIMPQMIFFVVPNKNSLVYERIKKNMDCRFFCLSQVLQGANIGKLNLQYMSNVAMKVNAKLGGITCKATLPGASPSHISPFFSHPTMMIGVDVSHASPGSGSPSMAAMTVSMDKTATRYAAACETNGWRDEVLRSTTANTLFPRLLRQWMKYNRTVPEHVYYFRDGIDEGQFQAVVETEVDSLRRIFREHNAGNPKFTVIIATKRHHIRFFPRKGDANTGDRNGNPLPGTLVERDATHPHHFDFYLCSHVAIQGTARPVHYQVIHDDVGVSPDLLQNMIYHQCYQYARATTPVSLHPAIYYAHVASNRARAHEKIPSSRKENPGGKAGFPTAKHSSEVYSDKSQREADPPALIPMLIDGELPEHIAFLNNTMWYI